MSEHTIKAFDTDLQELVRKVAEMGGLAERQITDAVAALIKRDTAQAERVMAIDTNIDALQREIEEKGILIIARRLLSDPDTRFSDLGPDWHDRIAPLRRKRQLIAELERLSGKKVTLHNTA